MPRAVSAVPVAGDDGVGIKPERGGGLYGGIRLLPSAAAGRADRCGGILMDTPAHLVFAGVNGAGKSTLYHADFWQTEALTHAMPCVDADDILIEQGGGDPASRSNQLRSGREALHRLDGCLVRGLSFNRETTLTGQKCIRSIERARQEGYRIVVYYVGVSSANLALSCIEHRGALGGHIIDEGTVRRRWRSSLFNLSHVVKICNEVNVINNTVRFVPIARWTNGVLSWAGNLKTHGT